MIEKHHYEWMRVSDWNDYPEAILVFHDYCDIPRRYIPENHDAMKLCEQAIKYLGGCFGDGYVHPEYSDYENLKDAYEGIMREVSA